MTHFFLTFTVIKRLHSSQAFAYIFKTHEVHLLVVHSARIYLWSSYGTKPLCPLWGFGVKGAGAHLQSFRVPSAASIFSMGGHTPISST